MEFMRKEAYGREGKHKNTVLMISRLLFMILLSLTIRDQKAISDLIFLSVLPCHNLSLHRVEGHFKKLSSQFSSLQL